MFRIFKLFRKKEKPPIQYKIVTLENKLGQSRYVAYATVSSRGGFVPLCYSKYAKYIRAALNDDEYMFDTYEQAAAIINEHKENEAKRTESIRQAELAQFVPIKTDML